MRMVLVLALAGGCIDRADDALSIARAVHQPVSCLFAPGPSPNMQGGPCDEGGTFAIAEDALELTNCKTQLGTVSGSLTLHKDCGAPDSTSGYDGEVLWSLDGHTRVCDLALDVSGTLDVCTDAAGIEGPCERNLWFRGAVCNTPISTEVDCDGQTCITFDR